MLGDVMHVRSTVTLSIKHRDVFTQHPHHGHLRCGEYMLLDPSVLQHPRDTILVITNYFSKWAKVVSLKEVKTPNMIKFIKHHVLYHFGVRQQIVQDNGPRQSNILEIL